MASGLKSALENDQSVFDADRLQKYTGTTTLESLSFLFWKLWVISNVNDQIAPYFSSSCLTFLHTLRPRIAWTIEMAKTTSFGRWTCPLNARGTFWCFYNFQNTSKITLLPSTNQKNDVYISYMYVLGWVWAGEKLQGKGIQHCWILWKISYNSCCYNRTSFSWYLRFYPFVFPLSIV